LIESLFHTTAAVYAKWPDAGWAERRLRLDISYMPSSALSRRLTEGQVKR